MTRRSVTVGDDGSIVLPAEIQHELGLERGATVILEVVDADTNRVATLRRRRQLADELFGSLAHRANEAATARAHEWSAAARQRDERSATRER